MIIGISAAHETYWRVQPIGPSAPPVIAELPLGEMIGYIEKHGTATRIHSTEEIDIIIGPIEYTDAADEAELRQALRAG